MAAVEGFAVIWRDSPCVTRNILMIIKMPYASEVMRSSAILRDPLRSSAILCDALQYSARLYDALRYSTILYDTLRYSIIKNAK